MPPRLLGRCGRGGIVPETCKHFQPGVDLQARLGRLLCLLEGGDTYTEMQTQESFLSVQTGLLVSDTPPSRQC